MSVMPMILRKSLNNVLRGKKARKLEPCGWKEQKTEKKRSLKTTIIGISKKFTFLYIPSRSRVIWIEQGREIKIDKQENDKIYINIKALDKITAKTSAIRLTIGEKKFFGSLEIKVLKCQLSENGEFMDTVAYLQVKDLSAKDNNQVFLFNGWTFASSPTLQSIDHPIYDLWITSCENI